jgi:hypothetical protein
MIVFEESTIELLALMASSSATDGLALVCDPARNSRHLRRMVPERRIAMTAVLSVMGAWVALNAALAVALFARRHRPKWRARLFAWVIRGERRPRPPVGTRAPARGH